MNHLVPTLIDLLRRASSRLPHDVQDALAQARDREPPDSPAATALRFVLDNVALAASAQTPLCQDTGTNIWHVYHPVGTSQRALRAAIVDATRKATADGALRPNAVHPITGKNSGDGVGEMAPLISFYEWNADTITCDLLLKGGGCENVSAQYTLPDATLGADRDLEGVRKVVLHAVYAAQGRGCSPGILGVGIGGDRISSMMVAKHQLFRLLTDRNPETRLADLEERITVQANQLQVGPMGFGGRTTVLGCKIGWAHRVPASYYVSVSYMCWACRRASVTIAPDGTTHFGEVSQIAAAYLQPSEDAP